MNAMATTTEATQPRPAEVSSGARRPWQRGFWGLIITQFQGAFSDNTYKFLVTFLIIGMGLSPEQRDKLVPLVGVLFATPFILFSMAGGYLADRYSKRSVVIGTKVAEIFVMTLALAGFWLNSVPLLLSVVFLMSTHSAFFGPTKYGLLPELLPEQRLSWGNGVLGLGTFVAIIAGTVTAGRLSEEFGKQQTWSGVILIALACLGTLASLGIDRVPAADAGKKFRFNFFGDLHGQLALIRKDRVLFLAVLGFTYFWFLGALLQPNIIFYGKDVLRLNDEQSGWLQASLAIGIGVGSLAAGHLSGKKIEYGLIPLGGFGLTAFAALLSRSDLTFATVALHLALLGFSGGFFALPINALIQHRPDRGSKGGVIAAAAFLSWVGVLLAAVVYYLFTGIMHLAPPQIFLAGSIMTLAGTVYILWLLPDSLLRLLLWFLTHSLYRIKVEGRDNIPDKGGALFVSNHLSLADALLVLASTDRFVRFIMLKDVYERPLMKPFAKVMGAIPISSRQRPREMIHALREASESIKRGEVVCIFAEGQITRIGQLLPFRRGFERIMQGVDAPIIPICLDDVWGSIFSYERHRFLWKIPRRIPYPVTVSYGKPMPASATPFEVRRAVQELSAEAWRNRKDRMRPLQRSFVETARRYPFRFAMADARVPNLRFGAALTRTIFLARRLQPEWRGQKRVGILLPPSVPGALVNVAALLMGKVPVNLNYTASEEIIASCVRQCGIETVISSKAFLDKVKIKAPGRCVLLEELAAKPRLSEKLAAFAVAGFTPAGLLEKLLGREQRITLDDPATIIFSSGSTGDPKGVVLTHYNIASNIEQLEQTFALDRRDRLLGILPFFHSFGFTGTLCLPGVLGAGVVYHPSPLDAEAVGGLVEKYAATFLLATPTFLQLYLRSCSADEFGSLQFVMAGAEKLSERLASAFEEKFGIRPLEGYGCTECSPVVSVNTHDFRSAGMRQVGAKRGKIGHPLPGISVRIVDPETKAPVAVNQPGLLQVKGPNVMQGYLGRPEKTAEVLADGWYTTGDIAAEDEDGFLQITDRLSRFSKIGGEMVPHIRVEEKLHELAGVTEQTFVVTGVPDEKKGERLVVLHTTNDEKLKTVLERLPQGDLPNLWIPRANQFYHVDTLPLLGTGKLDLRKIRERAIQLSTGAQ
jgi:acyl-[acyl-carrier-protein]-phospholipid O-acyltransferase / long-chain-fatty-acid--[acyl-carrier-protein] ligase